MSYPASSKALKNCSLVNAATVLPVSNSSTFSETSERLAAFTFVIPGPIAPIKVTATKLEIIDFPNTDLVILIKHQSFLLYQ